MKHHIDQYTLLFSLSWIALYLVHPSWALPISLTARGFLYFGLIIYFGVSAYVMKRLLNSLPIKGPVIVLPQNFPGHIRNNIPLLIILSIAVALHIYPISAPIYLVGDETLFLQGGLWIYDYFGRFQHYCTKYLFWILIVLALYIRKKAGDGSGVTLSRHETGISTIFFFLLSTAFLVIYFSLLHDLPYETTMIRYPPLQKFLYLISYYIGGINYIGPRIVQLIFYLSSAVYIYRTITLFSGKETALLGASIYLFSPLIFSYAHFAELASGVVFFIVIISYYFLRFLIYQDTRGLTLATYFTGLGFLYKRDIFLMFFICSAYLILHKFKDRDSRIIKPLAVLSLSLFPIIPWLIIGELFNWRNAAISLSQFASLKKVTAYFLMLPLHLSWGIFFLILLSVVFRLFLKRDTLSLYFGFLFIAFYAFYTAQFYGQNYPRFTMAFYPSIAIFLARFLAEVSQRIRYKHAFKIIFSVLTVYMIILSTLPSTSTGLSTFKNKKVQYFPGKKPMSWIKDNVVAGERILSLRFRADLFYRDKYGLDPDSIISFWYHLKEVSTPERLRAFCSQNNVSYIIFPHGPEFIWGGDNKKILDYLRDNKNNEFIETAKFNIGENFVYIYKLKK